MFKVFILVCSMNLAPQDCEMKNAIHVIAGPMVSNELSCGLFAQTPIAVALAPTDAEYVKIQCKRPSSTEASTHPSAGRLSDNRTLIIDATWGVQIIDDLTHPASASLDR
jgi:hypothetical protein